jgi:hypothetical protein
MVGEREGCQCDVLEFHLFTPQGEIHPVPNGHPKIKSRFVHWGGLSTDYFPAVFFSPTQPPPCPGIVTPGGVIGLQSPPTRATTIRNQLLYIVFYSLYIGV